MLFRSFPILAALMALAVPARTTGMRSDLPRVTVLVLGTAQDGGIPQAGCVCARCVRARKDPSSARLVASIAIVNETEGRVYLIDAGPDIKEQLDRIGRAFPLLRRPPRRPVDAILLTHAHMGHIVGLLQFGREAIAPRALPLFATRSEERRVGKECRL